MKRYYINFTEGASNKNGYVTISFTFNIAFARTHARTHVHM